MRSGVGAPVDAPMPSAVVRNPESLLTQFDATGVGVDGSSSFGKKSRASASVAATCDAGRL
jgi:hypothetical protein